MRPSLKFPKKNSGHPLPLHLNLEVRGLESLATRPMEPKHEQKRNGENPGQGDITGDPSEP